MNLNEAITMGRQVLDQERDSAASWETRRMLLRTTLQMVLDAIEEHEAGDDDEEPVPPAVIQAAKNLFPRPGADHRPGGCECGGHVDAVGVFHAAVAS